MNKEHIRYAALFAAGMGVGVGLGWLSTRRRYEALANEEIASIKETYTTPRELEDRISHTKPDLQAMRKLIEENQTKVSQGKEVTESYLKRVTDYHTPAAEATEQVVISPEDPPEELMTVESELEEAEEAVEQAEENIFDKYSVPERDTSRPYVISLLEWGEGQSEYETANLTYWEGDDTLADERDAVVPNPESIVGDALTHFGEDSGDKNTVFVRNEKYGIEYEISREYRAYSDFVLGIEPDKEPRVRKMRADE